MSNIANLFGKVGTSFLLFIQSIGQLTLFIYKTIYHTFTRPFYCRNLMDQLINIGFLSLPLIGLTSLFSGAVMVLQTYASFSQLMSESTIPTIVVLSITRELAPVLLGLVLSGRVGASIAAEIGTMRVTEQIDALQILSTNPIKYLVVPRILALTISLPILVLIADAIGVMGGLITATIKLGFDPHTYMINTFYMLKTVDVVCGVTKACVFGIIIGSISCFMGYNTTDGAQGVGKSTTQSVVISSVLILISNYFITYLFV